MGRYPTTPATRGSQKWIQEAVNRHPEILDEALGFSSAEPIEWLSPRQADHYAEYRDGAALRLLGIDPNVELIEFWPLKGPQWDALGRTADGTPILLEAKAHLGEMVTGASAARNPLSMDLIDRGLREAAAWVGADTRMPWNGPLYQMANRIAHLYYLRVLNQIPACLVFLYFYGDADMCGPRTQEEWEGAVSLAHRLLGFTSRPPGMSDVYLDVVSIVE